MREEIPATSIEQAFTSFPSTQKSHINIIASSSNYQRETATQEFSVMIEVTRDTTCLICRGATIGLTPPAMLTEDSKAGWENDSTMKLLNLKKVEVQLRFCLICLHSIIFPKFDAAQIYGENGSKIRKQVFEAYFPGQIYGEKKRKLEFSEDLLGASQEFLRFHQVMSLLGKFGQLSVGEDEELRILDWGGGDGYVSTLYTTALDAITTLRVSNYVYDHTVWKDSQTNKVGLKDLEEMPPFHLIIFSHVLEHTHDSVLTLKQAASFLSDQGLVICEVPDERLTIVKTIFRRRTGLNYHVHHFTRRSLHKLFDNADFSSIKTDYQFNSSYRGGKISSILGIGKVKGGKREDIPSFIYEFVSLVKFVLLKVATKFRRIVGFST